MGLPKGRTNNPNGAPKKEMSLSKLFRERLEETRKIKDADGKKKKIKLANVFIDKVIELALSGDFHAIKLIIEYVDGKPLQRHLNANADIKELSDEDKKVLWDSLKKDFGLQ